MHMQCTKIYDAEMQYTVHIKERVLNIQVMV